jgi:hypothetical protein
MADYTDLSDTDIPVTHSFPCGAGGEDQTDPVVTVVSPVPDSTIDRNATIIFDVTDDFDIRDTIVWVEIAGRWEVIYGGDADGFAPGYLSSSRSVVANGYRYTIRRDGGWISSPTFRAKVFDTSGNVAS